MSEAQPIEPLEFDEAMDDVDTEYPIVKAGLYDLEIQGPITKERNKKDTGDNGVIKFKLVDDAVSIKDKPVNAGLTFTEWYPLQSFDKDTGQPTKKWKDNWARLFDAALGTTQANRPTFGTAIVAIPGRIVRARIIVENDDNGIPRNRIKNFVKVEVDEADVEENLNEV